MLGTKMYSPPRILTKLTVLNSIGPMLVGQVCSIGASGASFSPWNCPITASNPVPSRTKSSPSVLQMTMAGT